MGVTLDLNTDRDGELWNLSTLQGWLATSCLSNITSLPFLESESSTFVLKGIITHIHSRSRDENLIQVHCSCKSQMVEDMEGQFKCEKCQSSGMVEITKDNNALKVDNLIMTQ